MNDTISRQSAIDIASGYCHPANIAKELAKLPPAQPDSCNGCKWEDAFGYGECHHCKRRFDDMYEVKDDE